MFVYTLSDVLGLMVLALVVVVSVVVFVAEKFKKVK